MDGSGPTGSHARSNDRRRTMRDLLRHTAAKEIRGTSRRTAAYGHLRAAKLGRIDASYRRFNRKRRATVATRLSRITPRTFAIVATLWLIMPAAAAASAGPGAIARPAASIGAVNARLS